MNTNLKQEADAFDKRVEERIRNGLIPDLRNCQANEWFYNNPWRHPEYVNMVFGEYLSFAVKHIPPKSKVVEIGSGLGHMTLELVRLGYTVTGVELSPFSVKVAQETAFLYLEEDKLKALDYVNQDFFSWHPDKKFDVVCFFLTLHHFENIEKVVQKAYDLLEENGKIIVIEPARDLFSKRNAAIVALIRVLLSTNKNWYESIESPSTIDQLNSYVSDILFEYQEAREINEKEQSPNDNSAFAQEMLSILRNRFEEIELKYGNTLIPRLIGGIRAETQEKTLEIARFIKLFDQYCTDSNLLEPGVFYFSGIKNTK